MIPIFVLTLRNSKREKTIKELLNKYELNYKIFYGVDGRKIKNHNFLRKIYNKKKAEYNLGRKMPYSEISASYGHLKIYKYIIKNKVENALILEDDAWPSNKLKKILKLKKLPIDYDIIGLNCYDGFVYKKPDIKILNKFNIHEAYTHLINISAYIISIRACDIIVKKTKGKVVNVPDWPINFMKNKIKSCILLPYPVIIDDKNCSYLRNDRAKLTPVNIFKKFIPNTFFDFLSFLFYFLHIPYLNGRYPNYDFYKEHFFDKKKAFIKNMFFKNLINTKKIIHQKKFYLKELYFKVDDISKNIK